MITIATFSNPQAADFAKTRLEAAGIKVFCPDNAVAGFIAGEGPMVAGIRLQVSDADATLAHELLKALQSTPGEIQP